jgi:hypothetical protein
MTQLFEEDFTQWIRIVATTDYNIGYVFENGPAAPIRPHNSSISVAHTGTAVIRSIGSPATAKRSLSGKMAINAKKPPSSKTTPKAAKVTAPEDTTSNTNKEVAKPKRKRPLPNQATQTAKAATTSRPTQASASQTAKAATKPPTQLTGTRRSSRQSIQTDFFDAKNRLLLKQRPPTAPRHSTSSAVLPSTNNTSSDEANSIVNEDDASSIVNEDDANSIGNSAAAPIVLSSTDESSSDDTGSGNNNDTPHAKRPKTTETAPSEPKRASLPKQQRRPTSAMALCLSLFEPAASFETATKTQRSLAVTYANIAAKLNIQLLTYHFRPNTGTTTFSPKEDIFLEFVTKLEEIRAVPGVAEAVEKNAMHPDNIQLPDHDAHRTSITELRDAAIHLVDTYELASELQKAHRLVYAADWHKLHTREVPPPSHILFPRKYYTTTIDQTLRAEYVKPRAEHMTDEHFDKAVSLAFKDLRYTSWAGSDFRALPEENYTSTTWTSYKTLARGESLTSPPLVINTSPHNRTPEYATPANINKR